MADLADPRAKLWRARHHAEEFDAAMQEIFNARPFELKVDTTDDGWCHIRWHANGSAPDLRPISLIFGDMLYNLRASLDYISWQLVLANGKVPGRHTSFPCVRAAEKWPSAVTGPLRDIDPEWIAKIAKLQPFDASHAINAEFHSLALLDQANNVTKHRLLPAALVSAGYAGHQINGLTPGAQMEFFFNDAPIIDGADHFRFTFDRPTNIMVNVDPNPRFRVRFSDITSYDWKNWDLVNWVDAAIAVFEPAFA
jgi:hypothetical protein